MSDRVSGDVVERIRNMSAKMAQKSLVEQKKQIKLNSPYSDEVNEAFSGFDEFYHLVSIGLVEAVVTRKALIREIDPDLYITHTGCTNRELMKRGLSPYLQDDPDTALILHHIGQGYCAPFAELTEAEHARFGNSKLLHNSKMESFRRDEEKDNNSRAEKAAYWKQRAKQPLEIVAQAIDVVPFESAEVDMYEVTTALETLFEGCTAEYLRYISNLAESMSLIKEFGARTVEEFILKDSERIIKCPYCKSENVSFGGNYKTKKEAKQGYKCTSCERKFSLTQGTIICGCSMTLFEWLRFINCLYNGFSIEKTAKLCGISEKSAFDNRMRLFYALSILDSQIILQGNIAIDETYKAVSYKGNRTQQSGFTMPRKAHKRGKQSHTPGTSKEKVCIACAIDDSGNSVALVAGLGNPTAKKLTAVLKEHIEINETTQLFSDKSAAIRKFAEDNHFLIRQEKLKTKKKRKNRDYEAVGYIQKINSYHSRLDKSLDAFNGLSSDLIQGYVSLFAWRDRNRDKEPIEAYKEILSVMITPGLYKTPKQIVQDGVICNPFEVEDEYTAKKKAFQNIQHEKKAREIYAAYAKGIPTSKLAVKYGYTPQNIRRIIRKCHLTGIAYPTEKEKAKAAQVKPDPLKVKMEKANQAAASLVELYNRKKAWEGPSRLFFEQLSQETGLAVKTLKEKIAFGRRIVNLQETFSVHEKHEYMTTREIFEMIYNRYCELKMVSPNKAQYHLCKQLEKEFPYCWSMIAQIVSSTEKSKIDWDAKVERKLPATQTLYRDRAIFADAVLWPGQKKDFLEFAMKKYHISKNGIDCILNLCCMADPQRYAFLPED